MKQTVIYFSLTIAVVIALGFVGSMDHQSVTSDVDEYCRMVKQFRDTDGAFGWPDYENAYESWCSKGEYANAE